MRYSELIENNVTVEAPLITEAEGKAKTKLIRIPGELYLSTVCDQAPQLLPVLIEGEISAYGRLSAMAYAFMGGERRTILTFQAKVKDGILTIEAVSDPSKLLLGTARLASYDPNAAKNPDLQCKNDPIAATRRAIEHLGKSQNTK